MTVETLDLTVRGMSCEGCVRGIENKLGATPGVIKVAVDLNGANAHVEYDIDLVKPEAIVNAVRALGYEVTA